MFDTIFLDRDGTINDVGYGYINGLSDFHFYDYAFEALDILKGHAKNFIIVTNQSGLSTGRVSIKKECKPNLIANDLLHAAKEIELI